jgi:hypothetical protein
MPRHDIFIEIESRESVSGIDDLTPKALPILTQEDSLTLRLYLLSSPDQSTIERVITTSRTIEVTIGKKAGNSTALYTQQFTWTANSDLADPYWEATFPMNTAAIATLLGAKDHISTWFEVVLIDDGDESTVLSKSVQIEARVNKAGTVEAPEGETLLTVQMALAMFAPISGFQGKLRLISPDGTKQGDVYWGDDNTLHGDPVS